MYCILLFIYLLGVFLFLGLIVFPSEIPIQIYVAANFTFEKFWQGSYYFLKNYIGSSWESFSSSGFNFKNGIKVENSNYCTYY
jgi:hypothetical protein